MILDKPSRDRTKILLTFFGFLIPALSFGATDGPPSTGSCSYSTWIWNVRTRTSMSHGHVIKKRSEITDEEIDRATGCTVCEEDQETIDLPPLSTFRICRHLAGNVRETLRKLQTEGVPLFEVVGYRVGKSSGGLDPQGNRTKFSNHSYGIAIDINPEQNGLYNRCKAFTTACRLRRGGKWVPGVPGTLERDGVVVRSMKEIGFRWGGEIAGFQKDFMHFSPTGY